VPTEFNVADYWTAAAATFDAEPDHGLTAPVVRAAWSSRLREWIPSPGADVLDVGCGTGSLAALLSEHGHQVTGVDLSPGMIAKAERKLAGYQVQILLGDAADPPVGNRRFDVVLARHLVWALPNPLTALRRWIGLLRPGGHVVLIEGRWGTDDPDSWSAGVSATALTAAISPLVTRVHVEYLTDPTLWGKQIHDERYALLAHV
jgi:ubiquinone/menaquinone biosynthesis C-methylase UbiE